MEMGMIIIGQCQECEYKNSFFVGGSNTFPFSYTRNKNRAILNLRVRDAVLSDHKKYILEFFKQDKKVEVCFAKFDLFSCSNCCNIESKYYYEVCLDDTKLIPTYFCNKCNNELKMTKSNLIDFSFEAYKNLKLNCPVCKNRNLVWEEGVIELD